MRKKRASTYNENETEIYGNLYDKYSSKNKLEKLIVRNFLKNLKELIKPLNIKNLLDVGCGEGFIANLMFESIKCSVIGIDIGESVIKKAKNDYPKISFIQASAYRLPFKDKSFELVAAIEILEHLKNPIEALKEFKRVSKKWLIISVPQEPLWRILNILRFKYLNRFGNTPGHIQHWTANSLSQLLTDNHFKIAKIKVSTPWIITLCEVRRK